LKNQPLTPYINDIYKSKPVLLLEIQNSKISI